jgi:hypothetical protein
MKYDMQENFNVHAFVLGYIPTTNHCTDEGGCPFFVEDFGFCQLFQRPVLFENERVDECIEGFYMKKASVILVE